MRRFRVICCVASSTQQMNSLRAKGVMSLQAASAVELASSASRRSRGSLCTTPPGTRSPVTEAFLPRQFGAAPELGDEVDSVSRPVKNHQLRSFRRPLLPCSLFRRHGRSLAFSRSDRRLRLSAGVFAPEEQGQRPKRPSLCSSRSRQASYPRSSTIADTSSRPEPRPRRFDRRRCVPARWRRCLATSFPDGDSIGRRGK